MNSLTTTVPVKATKPLHSTLRNWFSQKYMKFQENKVYGWPSSPNLCPTLDVICVYPCLLCHSLHFGGSWDNSVPLVYFCLHEDISKMYSKCSETLDEGWYYGTVFLQKDYNNENKQINKFF